MPEGIDVARLGRLVRKKREASKMSLRELADATKLKIPTISRVERGASKDLETPTLLALSKWLGHDWEDFQQKRATTVVNRKGKPVEHTPDVVEVYLRADKNLDTATAHALSLLFRTTYEKMVQTLKKA
jgi:transcriptional regulator with XRE-family HTH domain